VKENFVKEAHKLSKHEVTFDKYIAHIKETDNKKGDMYIKGRFNAVWTGIITVMQCFPKAGEFFLKHVRRAIGSMSNRSRNICSPDTTLLGCANHVNFIALKLLKKVLPAYTSFLNNTDLEHKMDVEWRRIAKYGKPVALSTDFASHDTN